MTGSLEGLSIVITRAREQASELADLLTAEGATVLELPLIELLPPLDWTPVEAALRNLHSYDWILFTSANAVRFLSTRATPTNIEVCCIGPKTRAVAEQAGWNVTLVPPEYVAESILKAFPDSMQGKRVLLPRAAVARDLVPEALRERGATVDIVEVYRNAIPENAGRDAAAILSTKPDWIAFTSSSTVRNLLAVAPRELLAGIRIASIGPATSGCAHEHRLHVDAEANPHTLQGLAGAIRTSIIRPVGGR